MGIGQAAFFKECLRCIQNRGQIPGQKVQIPVIQAGGPAQEGHCFRSGLVQNCFLQRVPEIQDIFAPLLAGKARQGITEETGGNAVPVVLVHHIAAGTQVVVDEHWESAGSNIGIQPPVSLRIFDRFQLIGKIAVFQIVAAVPPEGEAHAL